MSVGSKWYAWGYHWTIVSDCTVDGEPGLRIRRDGVRRIIARLFERYATPSGV